ncbi:MAG: CRISPR-associated protein Cas4 [Eubacterium sp.]|nr:CRISPR-associated protein Cas4 [Eubacterium sp.]
MYTEEDYLQLSGIQHFAFCRRQWALIHIEQQWAENLRTVEGHIMHERAHDSSIAEKRGDLIISRAMPVHSATLGISGECDIVEFHRSDDGVFIPEYNGKFTVTPVEYKRGSPKENDVDELQLCAQAICLEEMLCCDIPIGYIYYGETRRRQKVALSEELRGRVKALLEEMHRLYDRGHTPMVKRTKSCNSCSIKDLCLPTIEKRRSVKEYIDSILEEVTDQ